MRLYPASLAFNAGELSPLLEGRVDLPFYGAGAAACENFLPTVQGPIVRRPGFIFKGELGHGLGDEPARAVVLLRFAFRAGESYLLEVGDGYMHFWAQGGQVLSGEGLEPLHLEAPWPVAALFDADGCPTIDLAVSYDVAWLTVPGYPVHQLNRLGPSTFELVEFTPVDGPFLAMNPDPDLLFWVEDLSGTTCRLKASGTGATSLLIGTGDVDRIVRLWPEQTGARPWEPDTKVALNDVRTFGGRFYKAVDKVGASWPHYTGTVSPTHVRGQEWDGSGTRAQADGGTGTAGILWQYLHSGFGLVRITNVRTSTLLADGTAAVDCDAVVIDETPDGRQLTLPTGIQTTSFKTSRWELGAWSPSTGYPEAVTIFKERLTFGARRYVWFSRTDSFASFGDRSDADILATDAIVTPIGGERAGAVRWLVGGGPRLIVGTDNGVVAIEASASGQPFGPGNLNVSEQTADPVRRVRPVVAGNRVLFVERSGQPLRAITFDITREALESADLGLRAEHVARAGIVSMAWQGPPESVLWCTLGDGSLVSFTYDPAQEVVAWARHPLSARDGLEHPAGPQAIQVQTIPGSPGDDGADEVWLLMAELAGYYTPPGSPPQPWFASTLHRLARPHRPGDDRAAAVYLDRSLTYAGPPTTTLGGLGHLEGSTVQVLADGAAHPARVVAGASITLDRSVTRATVGIPAPSLWRSMRLESGRKAGTSQAGFMRVVAATFRLLEAAGVRVGGHFGRKVSLDRREPGDVPGSPPALVTGDRRIRWPAGWRREQRIEIEATGALPATIEAVFPTVNVSEG
jgi:hypothetical protein